MTYDWRVRFAHNYAHSTLGNATNLGVVEMSDNTIAAVKSGEFGYQFGLYWPRQVYARALEELTRQGAEAVAFDVLFSETRPDQPGYIQTDGLLISSDDFLANQLKSSGNTILAADNNLLPAPLFRTNAWGIGNISTQRDPDGVLRKDQAFTDYRDWHPILKQVAAGLNLNLPKTRVEPGRISFFRMNAADDPIVFPTDASGAIAMTNIVNPIPAGYPASFMPFSTTRVWSMGIVLAAKELHLDLEHADIDLPRHRITLHGENGLTRIIPVDARGWFYIDWSISLNDPQLTEGAFEDLLAAEAQRHHAQGVADPWREDPRLNRWHHKLVVVGSTATGNDLADTGSTALESSTFLASKHWNVANSVITGRFVRTTPLAVNIMLIVVVGLVSAWMTWVVPRPIMGSIFMAGAVCAYLIIAVALFNHSRIWLPVVLPLFCSGLVTHLGALTYRVTVEQLEKKMIKALFARLVSPEVVNKVLGDKTISLNSLAGERREITIYFADIRGFTELTDAAQVENTEFVRRHALSPASAEDYLDEQARDVMKTVSLYLRIIADCVKKHQGLLDKYIGDCVMAFWGAPLPNPRHAVAGVRCAIEAQQNLHALNLQREEENRRREADNVARASAGLPPLPLLPVLSMGSGINTGPAIAGFMGSEAHLVNYTAFGREVNLASRLEGVSGFGRIIIGEGTYHALLRDEPELAKTCIELPAQTVKGFRERVRIFEVPWKLPPSNDGSAAQPTPARDNTPAPA